MNKRIFYLILMIPFFFAFRGAAADDQTLNEFDKFKVAVHEYIEIHPTPARLNKARTAALIRDFIFKAPDSPNYVKYLQYIDDQNSQHPEAIFDLAKDLQVHWEVRYAEPLFQTRNNRVSAATLSGTAVGVTALFAMSVVLIFKPTAAPKYFQMVRYLFPLTGTALGWTAGQALDRSGFLNGNTPPAPAHIMRLGIQTDETHLDADDLIREALPWLISIPVADFLVVTAATRILQTVKWTSRAATPFKIGTLLAGIVVSYALEKATDAGIDYLQFKNLTENVNSSRLLMDQALAQGIPDNDEALFMGAEKLSQAALDRKSVV